jgi:hypothetical protein
MTDNESNTPFADQVERDLAQFTEAMQTAWDLVRKAWRATQ